VLDEIATGALIDGTALARAIGRRTAEHVEALRAEGVVPTLAVVHVGDAVDAASYRRQIASSASRLGIAVRIAGLPAEPTAEELGSSLDALNGDPAVHGVLVQAPLPPDLRRMVQVRLRVEKDPEGVTPQHLGRLFLGIPEVLPCTPAAILAVIKSRLPDLTGVRVVVVNGSPLIGRPLAMLLIDEGATVTICTRHTRDLADETRRAEVLVVAAGCPGLIGPPHVAPGAVVIDAAVNQLPDGTICGDVDLPAVRDRVSAITPVPGGVGPVTTAMLLANVVALAEIYGRKDQRDV